MKNLLPFFKKYWLPTLFTILFLVTPSLVSAFELFPGEAQSLTDFRKYIKSFYQFSIAAGILLATVLIMIGGVIWVTSAGNPRRIGKAKEYIINAIIGIILLMGAYLILAAINPNLVELKDPSIPKLEDKSKKSGDGAGATAPAPASSGQQIRTIELVFTSPSYKIPQ